MTVEELIRKLSAFPQDMQVKVSALVIEDVDNIIQDGEDFVKITLKGESKWQ